MIIQLSFTILLLGFITGYYLHKVVKKEIDEYHKILLFTKIAIIFLLYQFIIYDMLKVDIKLCLIPIIILVLYLWKKKDYMIPTVTPFIILTFTSTTLYICMALFLIYSILETSLDNKNTIKNIVLSLISIALTFLS